MVAFCTCTVGRCFPYITKEQDRKSEKARVNFIISYTNLFWKNKNKIKQWASISNQIGDISKAKGDQ